MARICWCGSIVGALVAASLASAQAPRPIRVGPNVQVSRARSADTHYEVIASAHPRDSSKLIAASLIYDASGASAGTAVYSSIDGGATWTPTLIGAALQRTGDPATGYGPDGTAYYVTSLIPAGTAERSLLFFRSPDGGSNWTGPFSLPYMDRHYVVVDATGGRFAGRVYVNGNNRVPRSVSDFVIFRSSDRGASFEGPGKRDVFGRALATNMGNAVVMSDGTVVGVFAETTSQRARTALRATRSFDGGGSLAPATTIGEFVAGGERKGGNLANANAEPMLAIDPASPRFKDRLYVVWPDRRSGHARILFSSSSDRGATWTQPRAINDNPSTDTTDQFMPVVAVNRAGVVGVAWYDRRDRPDNLGWDVRFSASLDGGATFLPSVGVSEVGASFPAGTSRARSRPSQEPTSSASRDSLTIALARESFTFMGGDTAGLTVDARDNFHPVWVDNRTGVPQVWTAIVSVRP